jgi:hypothetical protein
MLNTAYSLMKNKVGGKMQGLRRKFAYSGIVLLLLSPLAFSHHSYTRFDMAKTLTLEGTVKEFQWTNPHVWIQLMVKDPVTGQEVEWSIESDSPNMLTKRGWSRKAIQPGDKAVAVVHPPKKAADNTGALDSLTINGQLIGGSSKPAATAVPAEGTK